MYGFRCEGAFTCGEYLAAARIFLVTDKARALRFTWESRSLCDRATSSTAPCTQSTTDAMNGYPPPVAATGSSWREVKHADGRAYYHNLATNETSWEKPDELKDEVEVRTLFNSLP